MKKILLAAVLGLAGTAQAGQLQGVVLRGAPTVTVVGGYRQVLPLQFDLRVTNNSGRTLVLGLQRLVRTAPAGSENNFCFGVNCYPATTTTSPAAADVRLTTGAFDDTGVLDYTPNNAPGIAVIRYAVFERGTQDSTYLTVRFDASRPLAAVASRSTESILAQPFPNPAARGEYVQLNFAGPAAAAGTVRVVSLGTGQVAEQFALNEAPAPPLDPSFIDWCGTGLLNNLPRHYFVAVAAAEGGAKTGLVFGTQGLAPGLYVCLLLDARGQLLAARRLQVQ